MRSISARSSAVAIPSRRRLGVDRHVHEVPDRVVARADQVADHLVALERRQADPDRLGELEHEHRQRPRGRERAALDRDDLREVGVGEAADLERLGEWSLAGSWRRLAQIVGKKGVAVDRLPCRTQPAYMLGAQAVGAVFVGRDGARPPRAALKRTAPSPTASGPQERREPLRERRRARARRARSRAARRASGGEHLAAPRVEDGEHGVGASGRPPRAPRASSRRRAAAPRLGERARRGDPDPQPGELPGPDPDREPRRPPPTRRPPPPAPPRPAPAGGRVRRARAGLRVVARLEDRAAGQQHGRHRAAWRCRARGRSRSLEPPPVAARVRERRRGARSAARRAAPSSPRRSGHSTNVTRSGPKYGSSSPGSSSSRPASR